MKNINYLLKKYQSNYVPGEERSHEYNNMIRQKNQLNQNIHLLHTINQELPTELQLNKTEIQVAETLAKTFHTHLKCLCRNCKKEVIFLVFLLHIQKVDKPGLQIEKEPISQKYGLTNNIYELIISRTLKYYMEQAPIPITQTTDYDHELLIRNGGV